jgi:hypothetical protein
VLCCTLVALHMGWGHLERPVQCYVLCVLVVLVWNAQPWAEHGCVYVSQSMHGCAGYKSGMVAAVMC